MILRCLRNTGKPSWSCPRYISSILLFSLSNIFAFLLTVLTGKGLKSHVSQRILLRLYYRMGSLNFKNRTQQTNWPKARSAFTHEEAGGIPWFRNGGESPHLNYSHRVFLPCGLFLPLEWSLDRTPEYVFWASSFTCELISSISKNIVSLLDTDNERVSLF